MRLPPLSKTRSGIAHSLCIAATAALGLAGCAPALPDLKPDLPPAWQAATGTGAQPTDLHGWWHTFDDPELDALVTRALGANLDVQQAAERVLAERAMQRHADARYLPALAARTTDAIDPDANAAYLVAGFDMTWELGLFGRRAGTQRSAQAALEASVADLRGARVTLVAEVVREWISLRAAQQQLALLTTASAARDAQLRALEVRARLHLAAPAAVDQAQAAAAQAAAALAEPRQAITASAQRLAVLLGQNHPDPAWQEPGKVPELGDWKLDGAPAELLRTRPDIARAEAEVLRSAGAQALAHADMYPSIGFGASVVWATDINNNHVHSTTPNAIASVGPMFNIPLFDWGMRVAAAHASNHALEASVLAYRQTVLEGVAEVETALDRVARQGEREAQDRTAWTALTRVADAARTRERIGLDDPLARADAELAATQAALELGTARAAHSLAYVALFKALGGAPLPTAPDPAATAPAAPQGGR